MADEQELREKLATLEQLLLASSALVARAGAAGGDLRQIADELRAHSALIEQRLREWRESIN